MSEKPLPNYDPFTGWHIPSWEIAAQRIKQKTDDPLDRFVYCNEPVGQEEEKLWRSQLNNLLQFVDNINISKAYQDE